jgi:IS5 family transposase
VKRSIVIDARGNFLSIVCGKANRHDQIFALQAIDDAVTHGSIKRPRRLGADKGYDSNTLRRQLYARKIYPCIARRSYRGNRVPAKEYQQSRYSRQRWKVERSFNWLNNNRRLDRFMEKHIKTYQGFCYLAFMKFYVKKLAE